MCGTIDHEQEHERRMKDIERRTGYTPPVPAEAPLPSNEVRLRAIRARYDNERTVGDPDFAKCAIGDIGYLLSLVESKAPIPAGAVPPSAGPSPDARQADEKLRAAVDEIMAACVNCRAKLAQCAEPCAHHAKLFAAASEAGLILAGPSPTAAPAEGTGTLREALREIALHGTTAPMEMGDVSESVAWWKRIAYECMAIAARALEVERRALPLEEGP